MLLSCPTRKAEQYEDFNGTQSNNLDFILFNLENKMQCLIKEAIISSRIQQCQRDFNTREEVPFSPQTIASLVLP